MVVSLGRKSFIQDEVDRREKVTEDPKAKQRCEADGGVWDEVTKTCKLVERDTAGQGTPTIGLAQTPRELREEEARSARFAEERRRVSAGIAAEKAAEALDKPLFQDITPQETEEDLTTDDKKDIIHPDGTVITDDKGELIGVWKGGKQFFPDNRADIEKIVSNILGGAARIPGTVSARERIEQERQQALGEAAAGQVGEVGTLETPRTKIDLKEALVAGLTGAIPSALSLAGTLGVGAAALGASTKAAVAAGAVSAGVQTGALTAGAVAGTGVGISALTAAGIGAGVGFTAGVISGMLSNMNSQRSDTTTSQQRVLDEGKQVLADWITIAKADPANRYTYLKHFNTQLALIEQAHGQMKIDTQADVLKFNTARPNLAEFSTFYGTQGERDFLVQEMRIALSTASDLTYETILMGSRYSK